MQFNTIKTYILLAAIIALFMIVGGLIGGKTGMVFAFMLALILNISAYWFSAEMILKAYDAQEVGPHNAPDLYSMIQDLSNRASLPMPKVYVINQEQPNAFATGRNQNNAAVAFTVGLIKLLNYDELEGVAAHELSHIKHNDILISTISAVVAGAISSLASFAMFFGTRDEEGKHNWITGILVAIFAPIAAALIQMAISRSREYMADEGAAYITYKPLALASALQKIEAYGHGIINPVAEEYPSTAQMMIINPLSGESDNLFSTHPATNNRIIRLKEISKKQN